MINCVDSSIMVSMNKYAFINRQIHETQFRQFIVYIVNDRSKLDKSNCTRWLTKIRRHKLLNSIGVIHDKYEIALEV